MVSGVSGAGKTEANKILIRYLCWRADHVTGQQRRNATVSADAFAAAERLASGDTKDLDALTLRIVSSQVLFETFGAIGAIRRAILGAIL